MSKSVNQQLFGKGGDRCFERQGRRERERERERELGERRREKECMGDLDPNEFLIRGWGWGATTVSAGDSLAYGRVFACVMCQTKLCEFSRVDREKREEE